MWHERIQIGTNTLQVGFLQNLQIIYQYDLIKSWNYVGELCQDHPFKITDFFY